MPNRVRRVTLTIAVSPQALPALVLNADYRPLSYYPLSLWSWQDAIKAVFLDRVNIIAEYEHSVSSPSFSMRLPSVVCLKTYVQPSRNPAFTRFNVFLRDKFECQYCGENDDLTFDHVIPRAHGGETTWQNVVAACSPCNLQKGQQAAEAGRHVPVARSRISRPCRTCTTTAGSFRRTICTTAGSTISTGIPNCSPDCRYFLMPICGRRRKRKPQGSGSQSHSSPQRKDRERAAPHRCRTGR